MLYAVSLSRAKNPSSCPSVNDTLIINFSVYQIQQRMGALHRGPGGPWPTQNFGWVGHNAFGPTNNWPVCSLVKLV